MWVLPREVWALPGRMRCRGGVWALPGGVWALPGEWMDNETWYPRSFTQTMMSTPTIVVEGLVRRDAVRYRTPRLSSPTSSLSACDRHISQGIRSRWPSNTRQYIAPTDSPSFPPRQFVLPASVMKTTLKQGGLDK